MPPEEEHKLKLLIVITGLLLAVGVCVWEGIAQAKGLPYNPDAALALISMIVGAGLRLSVKAAAKRLPKKTDEIPKLPKE